MHLSVCINLVFASLFSSLSVRSRRACGDVLAMGKNKKNWFDKTKAKKLPFPKRFQRKDSQNYHFKQWSYRKVKHEKWHEKYPICTSTKDNDNWNGRESDTTRKSRVNELREAIKATPEHELWKKLPRLSPEKAKEFGVSLTDGDYADYRLDQVGNVVHRLAKEGSPLFWVVDHIFPWYVRALQRSIVFQV